MSQAFGLGALQPGAAANLPHYLGFSAGRSVADDTLFEVWNGSTNASLVAKLDFEGRWSVGDGTVAKPAMRFTGDPDSGIYRIGANNIGVAVNGAKVLDVGTTGLGITGLLTVSTTLAVTGASTLTGAVGFGATLRGADGAVGAPAFSFTDDTDSGIYRIGANNIGVAANGAKVLDIAAAGLTVSGVLNVSSDLTVTGSILASTIRQGTGDGADSGSATLAGGGLATQDRGAYIVVHGNEHGQLGGISIVSGNAGGAITIGAAGNVNAGQFDAHDVANETRFLIGRGGGIGLQRVTLSGADGTGLTGKRVLCVPN